MHSALGRFAAIGLRLLLLLLLVCCGAVAKWRPAALAVLLLLLLLLLLLRRQLRAALGARGLLLKCRGVDLEPKHLGHVAICRQEGQGAGKLVCTKLQLWTCVNHQAYNTHAHTAFLRPPQATRRERACGLGWPQLRVGELEEVGKGGAKVCACRRQQRREAARMPLMGAQWSKLFCASQHQHSQL